MRFKGLLITVLTLSLTVLLFSGKFTYAKEARGVTDDTIKFGLIADMTGPCAHYGVQASAALRTYFRYINDRGGINGRKLKLIIEDDRYTIPGAMAAFKKLVFRDEILAIDGPSGTGHSQAMFRSFEKEKVPNIPWSNDSTMHTPLKKFIFSCPGDYRDQTYVIFDYIMKDLKARDPRIFFTYPDNGFGKVAFEHAKERAEFYGLKLAGTEILNFGCMDATSQVLNLKRGKPDYLIMQQVEATTTALLRDAKKYGLDIPFFGLMYCCEQDVIRMAGDAARNLICADAYDPWHTDTEGMKRVREITIKYNPGTEKQYRPKMYIRTFSDAITFVEAMKMAGRNLNNMTLVDALESLKDFDTGVCGLITYGPNDHKATDHSRFFKVDVQKKLFVPLTGWREPIVSR